MPISARKSDPLAGFRFRVVIENYNALGFKSVGGLKGETTAIPYREGTDRPIDRMIPGKTKYDPLVLKRGVDPDGTLQLIRNSIVLPDGPNFSDGVGEPQFRFNGFVYLLNKERRVIKQWQWTRGWASVHGIDDLDAMSEEIVLETIEIVHEGLIPVKV